MAKSSTNGVTVAAKPAYKPVVTRGGEGHQAHGRVDARRVAVPPLAVAAGVRSAELAEHGTKRMLDSFGMIRETRHDRKTVGKAVKPKPATLNPLNRCVVRQSADGRAPKRMSEAEFRQGAR